MLHFMLRPNLINAARNSGLCIWLVTFSSVWSGTVSCSWPVLWADLSYSVIEARTMSWRNLTLLTAAKPKLLLIWVINVWLIICTFGPLPLTTDNTTVPSIRLFFGNWRSTGRQYEAASPAISDQSPISFARNRLRFCKPGPTSLSVSCDKGRNRVERLLWYVGEIGVIRQS